MPGVSSPPSASRNSGSALMLPVPRSPDRPSTSEKLIGAPTASICALSPAPVESVLPQRMLFVTVGSSEKNAPPMPTPTEPPESSL